MLNRRLRVGRNRWEVLPQDRVGDPESVHSDCCLLGCRNWESSKDAVCVAAHESATVISVGLSGGARVCGEHSPVAGKGGAMALQVVVL